MDGLDELQTIQHHSSQLHISSNHRLSLLPPQSSTSSPHIIPSNMLSTILLALGLTATTLAHPLESRDNVQTVHLTFHGGPASYQLAIPANGQKFSTSTSSTISPSLLPTDPPQTTPSRSTSSTPPITTPSPSAPSTPTAKRPSSAASPPPACSRSLLAPRSPSPPSAARACACLPTATATLVASSLGLAATDSARPTSAVPGFSLLRQ
jgi:hypothetical protein